MNTGRRQHLSHALRAPRGPALLFAAICVLLSLLSVRTTHAGDPNFSTRRPFGAQGDPTITVAVGDMDGDGDLDLVTANKGKKHAVNLNDGAGNFPATRTFGSGSDNTYSMVIGDVDADGDLDVVIGTSRTDLDYEYCQCYQGGQIIAYLNDGLGNFPTTRVFGGGNYSYGLAIGDMDGDGDLDVVVGNLGRHMLYLNDGVGNFPSERAFGGESNNTYSMAVGDVDGDGDLDVVTGTYNQNVVYLNDGTGNFPSQRAFDSMENQTNSIALGDVDSDGDLDIVAGNNNQQSKVHLNDGAGNFTSARTFGGPTDRIFSVAIADMDGDGDLDIIAGKLTGQNLVYLNDGTGNFPTGMPFGAGTENTYSVAAGDMDSDGDLDIIIGNNNKQNGVYLNDGGGDLSVKRLFGGPANTYGMAIGDLDGDGDLDIVAGPPNVVYLNDGVGGFSTGRPIGGGSASIAVADMDGDGDLDIVTGNAWDQSVAYLNDGANPPNFTITRPFGGVGNYTYSVATGDLDRDGDLDIITGVFWGYNVQQNVVYLNDGANPPSFSDTRFFGTTENRARGIAVGDLDGDGDLDLVTGNSQAQNIVYWNDGAGNFPTERNFGTGRDSTRSVAVGDVDGDGDLDIVTGNYGEQNVVYLNDGAGNFLAERNFGTGGDYTTSVAVGDVDGDGDLDLVTGNAEQQNVVYLNDGMGNFPTGRNFGAGGGSNSTVAVGDMDGDGDLDLVTGNAIQQSLVTLNGLVGSTRLANSLPRVAITRPGLGANSAFFSTPQVLSDTVIPIAYTLADPEGDPVRFIRAFYSPDGGGRWLEALAATGTITTNLVTNPAGVAYTYQWDTFASGFFGQSDNVAFRIEVYPSLRPTPSGAPGPYQRPYASAQTFPFRVRGTQVRVLNGAQPAADALVYRLPAGQPAGGALISDAAGGALRTDPYGYLRGRGEIRTGDRLLALAPISSSDRYTLYATNGTPVSIGVESFGVADPGVQTLAVSAAHPLLLFDIDLSLEWDAHTDPSYLQQLAFDLKQTSRHLYDFTNGQVALGRVTVHQNADDWAYSDVVVHATNRLRPFAAQGGIVSAATVDPQHPEIVYDTGQVHMGASWNRYGIPGQNLGDDWSIILAHELSHYLLFQDDSYLGINPEGLLIPLGDCSGSAMGDVYTVDNTEFIFDQAFWQAHCADTLPNRSLGRTEWETIQLWYPGLVVPTTINDGPTIMPFDLTTVSAQSPITPTNTLEDQTFTLDYAGGVSSSSVGRALLLRDDYVMDLGSPYGGQNRVIARGARPGDRLCVFDQPRGQYGCEIIAIGDNRLALEQDSSWAPVIQISPVTSQTLHLAVAGVPNGLTLKARLLPEYGRAAAPITLSASGAGYAGTFSLAEPSMTGHVQVWVDEPALEANPRRETIEAYTISGNPGLSRGGGGLSRGGGGLSRGGGGLSRGGGAPLVSPDGQMIFFTANPAVFEVGDFYSVQGMAGLPPLPAEKVAIGAGYNLVASANAPLLTGSISFQYLGNDVLVERANEDELAIHYWDGQKWEVLPTVRDTYDNMASAPSRGPGIYALLAGVSKPSISSANPSTATNDLPAPLAISGSGFLGPVHVVLAGATASYTLPVTAMNPTMVTAVIPAGLPVDDYTVRVVNGDGGMATAPGTLGLYTPADARFYDFFASGMHKWTRDGTWAIATLPNGEQAITDSPAGNYDSAISPATTQRSTITSQPFSLDGLSDPVLSFRHDYVFANVGTSVDVGRVEISSDGGTTWTPLASYSGGGIYGPQTQALAVTAPEWATVNWKDVTLDLSHYSGVVQIRFSLEVDQTASDKGWLIDDVLVHSGTATVSSPSISGINPRMNTNDRPTTLKIDGSAFLGPVQVVLVGATTSYTLPVTTMSPTMVTTVVTPGLPVDDYTVRVVNGDGGMATAPGTLGLYTPADARFYDFFASGAHKWTLAGAWAIATLPNGEQAITDSPAGNYDSAIPPATTQRSTITSQPFSLDGLSDPVLSFRHDYVLANVGTSVDVGRVEISSDGGTTWTPLTSYRGGGIYGPQTQAQAVTAPEWATVNWKDVTLDLSHYSGVVQIRFSLEVDQTASDKGWLIDDVMIHSSSISISSDEHIYLPMVIR